MRHSRTSISTLVALVLILLGSTALRAETVVIQWQITSYAPIDINTGDSIRFEWASSHNLWRFSGQTAFNNCNFTGAVNESDSGITDPGAAESGPVTVLFDTPGTYYLGCGFASHCAAGMRIQVNVTDPVVDPIFRSRFELEPLLSQH